MFVTTFIVIIGWLVKVLVFVIFLFNSCPISIYRLLHQIDPIFLGLHFLHMEYLFEAP